MTINKQALREAAQEEIMLRSVSDTSDAWQDEASPEAVLALLDELEAAEKSNAFLKGQLAELANFNPDWDKLEAATYSLREHMSELKAARARIAELDAREVVLPQRISMEGGSYCTTHARYDEDGDYYYRDEVIESLVAAGIITKVGE